MSSSNSAHLWSIEAHTASADSSNPDTDESWRICTSSNALFRAQPADFHSDLVDANDSPDSFSACVPNLLTEFVFFLFGVFYAWCAAFANGAF
jgi:hypothetical protein